MPLERNDVNLERSDIKRRTPTDYGFHFWARVCRQDIAGTERRQSRLTAIGRYNTAIMGFPMWARGCRGGAAGVGRRQSRPPGFARPNIIIVGFPRRA